MKHLYFSKLCVENILHKIIILSDTKKQKRNHSAVRNKEHKKLCSGLKQHHVKLLFLTFQVKNKAPAEVQITAEQLLREAKERELELLPPPPKQKITDEEELNDYKLKKRKVCAHLSWSPLTACFYVNVQAEIWPKQLRFFNCNKKFGQYTIF